MFGYLRFILACLVLISHIGVTVYGLNPGVAAVVVFYILAGFVVSHLYNDIIVEGNYKILRFYKDRLMRIFPLYLYAVVLTIFFLLTTSFGSPHFSYIKMVSNLIIIPLNYYMVADFTILTNPSWCLIPPAWSLGTELQAYLLLPVVLLFPRFKLFVALSTFTVYIAANFSLIQPDYFGYRLLIGVFFIFIIGTSLQKNSAQGASASNFDKIFPASVWLVIVLLVPIFYMTDSFSPTYTKETFLGLIIGIPLVAAASKYKIKLSYDSFLGSLSYGIFLTHFLSIWIIKYSGLESRGTLLYAASIMLISVLLAWTGVVLIEKKCNKYRQMDKKDFFILKI